MLLSDQEMKDNHAAATELTAVLDELRHTVTAHVADQRLLDIWNESQAYVYGRSAQRATHADFIFRRCSCLSRILQSLGEMKAQGRLSQVVHSKSDKSKIAGMKEEIGRIITLFQIRIQMENIKAVQVSQQSYFMFTH